MKQHPCSIALIAILGTLPGLSLQSLAAPKHSDLWGAAGEKWDPRGRLPDFSFAGYARGEREIPAVPVVANVRDFGAKGDGVADDTAAFRQAIEKTARGAIEVPPGKYVITDILDIQKSNLVLRGAGPDKTTLYFPKFLEDVRPNPGHTTSGRPTSNYSWSGGFIWVRGSYQSDELTRIATPAKRGDTAIEVDSTEALKVGQQINVHQRDDDQNSLAGWLYAGDSGNMKELLGRTTTSLTTKIVKIERNRVTLDRALRCDLDPRWRPVVMRFEPTVREVGIEGMRFEYPVRPYGGHFTERGANAIAFKDVIDCWVRDVVIDHCDSGIFIDARFCTLDKVTFRSERPQDAALQCTGHHGIQFNDDDNLATRFRFDTKFIHDFTVLRCTGNVISAGSGVDLSFDHHKYAPYANLFTDIDVGAGNRTWKCGGGADLGKHSAAWETFWNIRAARPQSWPPKAFGPDLMNLVAVQSEEPAVKEPNGKWFEPIPPAELEPKDLHKAQLERRLRRKQ